MVNWVVLNINSKCCCSLTVSNDLRNTEFVGNRTNDSVFFDPCLQLVLCNRTRSVRNRSVCFRDLLIVKFQVCYVSILETSNLMVREVRCNRLCHIRTIIHTIVITIEERCLPEIATTSQSEDCSVCRFVSRCDTKRCIDRWIWHILRNDLRTTKVRTNNRNTSRADDTTVYRVELI